MKDVLRLYITKPERSKILYRADK